MSDEEEGSDDTLDDEYFPPYSCGEHKKDGFANITVQIKGLKVSTDLVLQGFLPRLKKKPKNAKVDVVFEDRSFCLTVEGEKGDMKWRNAKLHIKNLPHEIIPEECYYEMDTDRVFIYLSKKEDLSWRQFFQRGLKTIGDQAEIENEEDE